SASPISRIGSPSAGRKTPQSSPTACVEPGCLNDERSMEPSRPGRLPSRSSRASHPRGVRSDRTIRLGCDSPGALRSRKLLRGGSQEPLGQLTMTRHAEPCVALRRLAEQRAGGGPVTGGMPVEEHHRAEAAKVDLLQSLRQLFGLLQGNRKVAL